MGLVLASSSPRRRALLEAAGIPHRVLALPVDETPPSGLSPREVAVALAVRKARAVLDRAGEDRILAADTVVALDGVILDKPADEEEARRTLERLSGREHEVHTGLCLLDPRSGRVETGSATTRVRFRELTAAEIDAYVRSGEPMDKAGAYGIQGGAGSFVVSIDGPRDNVIGLPVEEVARLLEEER